MDRGPCLRGPAGGARSTVDQRRHGQREEDTGSSARASPGLGRRRGGWATTVNAQRHWCSVRGLLRRGERGKEAGRGAVKLSGGARLL
jgi:hypothetical protein